MRYRGLACIVSVAWIAAAPLLAGEQLTAHQMLVRARQDWLAAGKPVADAPDFGLASETAVEVQSYAFQPGISNDQVLDDGNGYRYYGATTADPYMAGAVQIPTGVSIDYLKFSGCVAADGDLVLGLYDNNVSNNPNVLIATLPLRLFVGGCGNDTTALINYTYPQNAHHPLYFVIYWANNPQNGTVKFNNAQIYYHRLVSPAPATATFGDVPTSDTGFQYIEALAASGITGGCGGGNFCPDSTLTRRQMAVFFAKALGLHWPY